MIKLRELTLVAIASLFIVGVTSIDTVSAACNNMSSFGAATYDLVELSNTSNKVLWVRMQSPEAGAKLTVEVGGDQCFEVGGFNAMPNEWSWQTYRNDSAVLPISFTSPENKTIKLIGTDNLKVDKLLVTDEVCQPEGRGDNCEQTASFADQSLDDYKVLPSPAGPVSGKVLLSNSPQDNSSNLKEVRYVVSGKVIQTSSSAEYFDTTLLSNGGHNVYITTELNNGDEVKELIKIEVDNSENAFSGIIRWIRLSTGSVVLVGLIVSLLILFAVGLFFARKYYRSRRERSFKGLDFK